MPTKTNTGQIDRFHYTPGDGHRYRWPAQGGRETIVVERIITRPGRPLAFADTGDRIPIPALRTASAMADAVRAWKAGRRA